MTEYVFWDGKFVDKNEAKLPIMTHAFLYGTSIFEGIRAYYNKEDEQLYAFRVPEHFQRLLNSAKIMRMTSPYTVAEYCEWTKKLLRKNDYHQNTYIRPNLYKCAEKIGPGLYDNPDSFLMFSLTMGDYIDTSKGLKVCVSNWRRNSDNAIPPRAKCAGAYANTALIKTDAHEAGFDDAIVLNEFGKVTEGSAMNFFMVIDGKLVTSSQTDNILLGVTRNTVMEMAKVMGIPCETREIDRTELYLADEAFYCGTGAQISPITSIDNRLLGDGKVGPIAKKLQDLYFETVKGNVKEFKKWCMPIYD